MNFLSETAWIAAPEDVILHKLVWNNMSPSERQLRDAAGVYAVQKPALDLDYLKRWAVPLGVEPDLNRVLSGAILPKST